LLSRTKDKVPVLVLTKKFCLHQANAASSSRVNAAGRNSVATSLMIGCGFIACWSLSEIYMLMMICGYIADLSGWFYHFTVALVFSSSCINPFIYAAKYHEFQTGVRRLLHEQIQPAVERLEMRPLVASLDAECNCSDRQL